VPSLKSHQVRGRSRGQSALFRDRSLRPSTHRGVRGASQVTLFPVITGRTGSDAVFEGAADVDLELIDRRTLDGSIRELTYGPSVHI
jgi:hypothetical protein